ncbi:secretin receptor-like [Liolophura sinensis]|uniref:secretin receptor-like n=1 Tax=Liolophura sinensis TaxID=3198878 RepID=UPI0031580227
MYVTMTSWTSQLTLFGVLLLVAIAQMEVVNMQMDQQSKLHDNARRECFVAIAKDPYPTGGIYCNRTWDGVMCWPDAPAGTTSIQPCADYIHGFDTSKTVTRVCLPHGEWMISELTNSSWSNYTACFARPTPDADGLPKLAEGVAKHLKNIVLIQNIGYGVSLVFLVFAVVIMIYFRKLHCQRNTIHINLFISFILRSAISFMTKNLLIENLGLPQDVYYTESGHIVFREEGTHWECKLLFTVFHYILGANYMWVFVEGLYLYILIFVAVFSEKRAFKWYIFFGWVSPLAFVTPWVLVRIFLEDTLCWNTHEVRGYYWIMKGPIVLSILVNFLFFLFIVRALFTKLRTSSRLECRRFRYRRLAKSTLVLIPLFGAYYIVFICIPDYSHHELELAKLYTECILSSFQGFIVALLFCFLNGEVQAEIRKKWGIGILPGRSNSGRSGTMSTVARGSTVISTGHEEGHHQPKRPAGGADDLAQFETMEMMPPPSNGHARKGDADVDTSQGLANGHMFFCGDVTGEHRPMI